MPQLMVSSCKQERFLSIILAKTDAGFTPLMLGVQSGNLEAIRLLVAHNADVNAQNGYQGIFEGFNDRE